MNKGESKFKAGMYLLETLTAGMYNEPLSIYREYIQNSVDSFEIVKKAKKKGPTLLKIEIDPSNRLVSVYDNGAGIPADAAEKTFSSIGSSEKQGDLLRGFRGIGRLGGLAFCDKAVFQTKAFEENIESIQEWDCKELRKLLSDTSKRNMDLKRLFELTTTFHQNNGKKNAGSYFKVTLFDVSSFRNHILDIRKIERYLQSVAPVPFNSCNFDFSDEIRSYLSKNIRNFGEFVIKLNGEEIYKPYKNTVRTSSKDAEKIEGVEFFELKTSSEVLGYGWYGRRCRLLGALTPREGVSGIRVKVGNITIGDEHLLDDCFRERRFNAYVVGEIHIVSPLLIPNSRRDNFVDNKEKSLFFNAVEREIGLPISKEIRLRSRLNSKELNSQRNIYSNSQNDNQELTTNSAYQDQHIRSGKPNNITDELFSICGNCKNVRAIIEKLKLKIP